MAISKYSALRNVLKDEEEEQKKNPAPASSIKNKVTTSTAPKKTTTATTSNSSKKTTTASTSTSSKKTTTPTTTVPKAVQAKTDTGGTKKTATQQTTATPKKTESKSKTLSFSEALGAKSSTTPTVSGGQLDTVRKTVQEKAETKKTSAAPTLAEIKADPIGALKNKNMSSPFVDITTPEGKKATLDAVQQTLKKNEVVQTLQNDAALRAQQEKINKLRREEEAKKQAYEELPVLDKLFNISADAYASDESRLRKAAEVEYDRMRMTPEEFEAQHKADLGESLYQIAHSAATGVAGSFAKAADVAVAVGAGLKNIHEVTSDPTRTEPVSFVKEFTEGYQESLTRDDSLYDQVYAQYEREYEENRRIDGEINTLTKYASQAANSIGEQAVMLWTSSISSALYSGSKIAGAIASKADDLVSSGKKGLKLVGKTLSKVDAGTLGGAASMLVTSSASATEQAINDMRAINEKRHSLGRVAAYTDETIARNAALYGVLNGLSETVLEYAIGGVTGAAGSALPSPKVKNPILTAALSYLKGAAGEGFEEMVQTLSSTGLEKLTYNENASVDWQEVIDSGIVGALSGAAMGVPAAVQNTKFGVSAMRDVSSAVKAAKKAETDAAGAFVAVSSTAKAQAYSEIADDIRKTGSENAETLASIYDWAAEQHLKVAETLTGDSSRAEVQEKAKKENKKQAKREAEQTASTAARDANATASANQTAEEAPNAAVNAITSDANTFEREANTPIQTTKTPVTASVEAPNATTSSEAVSSTQTPAQEETTSVQNKIRAEALQSENVSAENGGATVVTDFALQLQQGASKNTNLKTVQKLADAVRIVQSGQIPDKTYNEALNLLKNDTVRGMVETELGSDAVIDPKHIRSSLETVSKRYAETAERADMDSLSEEITSVVERSAEDKVTLETGQMTRAEFVRSFGAELAQRGLAADDVFDNLLAHERQMTLNDNVNAPLQAAEVPVMTTTETPNADVNAIDREVNTFEREANAPIQVAETPVMTATETPNADANAITSDANTFTSTPNAPLQTAVSRETVPNADVNAIDRDANVFEREVNGEAFPRIHREFSPEKQLTEVQNESIKALEMLSRAVNADIYLYDSADDEQYRFSSGRYDPASDRIYIDINAGAQYEGTILRTAGHELVHYAKRWSPESFQELSSFVEQTLTDSGADITALMNEKRAQAFRFGNTLSEETAYEEVIADACQTMLTDTDALSRLAETKPTVFERVMEFLRDFVDNIRRVYSDYKPSTEAGRVIAEQTRETADRLSEIYSRTLIEAGKARTEAQQLLSGQPSELDAAKTEQGSALFDYRVIRDDMTEYRRMLTEWGGMSDEDVDSLMQMVGLATDIVEKNKEKLDYGYDSDRKAERPFNPVKANSDKLYKISLDFSTLCRKRIVQAIVAENLERALERPLSREEAIRVRAALTEVQKNAKTIEVACALCYVEAARLKTPEQVTKVLQNLPTVLQRHYAAKNGDAKKAVADAEKVAKVDLGLPENKTLKSIKDEDVAARDLTAKEAKEIIRAAKKAALDNFALTDAQKAEIEYAQTLPVTAFTTAKGLAYLAQNHHDVYKAYADAVRSASRSKGLEADVPWRAGDSGSISDQLITLMNEGAGVRSQSWSDFQAIHLLDEIAMTIEMAARGAKMHDYTKVPDAVRLRGLTGRMQNMSLIPTRDGNGYDAVEGMPYEVMLMLRDQYPDTAGNICIGVNDEQILRLLDSDEIDYVIPYHHSGNSVATRRALKIPEWTSYQDIQTEKGGEGPAFAEWFNLDRARETAARENANPTDPAAKEKYGVQYGAYKAMQEAADRYLEISAERGLTPKFKGKVSGRNVDFTTHPNYWKLLIDRKMVNQITGEIIEQKPVQPIFDPKVIYGDPADGNVGGILGRALEYYDVHQADVMFAVAEVTRSTGKDVGAKSEVIEQIIGESVEDIRKGAVLFEYREDNIGYHAGDLGKSEFYHMQGGGRGTGHFGTGTYFVGNESQIGAGSGYESRPHHAANFSNYNLYKVRDGEDGRKLHRDLKAIDTGFPQRFLSAAEKDDFRVSELRGEAWRRSDKYDTTHYDADLGFEVSDDFIGAETRGFTEVANENGVPVLSYDEWLAQQSEDVPKQGDSDYDFYKSDYLAYLKETLNKADEEANNGYEDFRDAYFNLKLRFGTDNVNRALRAVLDHDKVMMPDGEFDYWSAHDKRADSRATIFMKALGYEGIDVRGTSLDNVEYGSVIYDLKPEDVLYDYRISGNEASAPRSSERDIASSPEFEAFIKAYDAVHGEGAARTIVRTTEQFDRERARQRKREATAAQMARLPDTEKRIAAEVKRLEADRRQREKIESLKNPATRKRRLAAQKNRALMRELLEAAKQNADMRVADQAYRDNVEMKVRLAEAQQKAEERLKGVSNNLRWTAEARAYEAKQTADERVRQAVEYGKERVKTEVQRTKDRQARQDYTEWWDENFFKKQDAEIRDAERQERKAYQNEISQLVRKRDRQFLEDNAEVRSAQLGYARDIRTDPEVLRNRSDRSNEVARENAAIQEVQHRMDFAARQAEAVQRTGASVISPTDAVQKAPVVESNQSAPLEHGFAEKQDSPFGKSLKEKVAGVPGKIRNLGAAGYRTFVNAAQGIDTVANKQRKMGFNVTASDLTTSVRNAKDTAAYILTDALVNQNGEALGESLSDIILVKDKHGKFDKKGQRVFDAYLKLKHHIDRMSIRDNAFLQLQEYLNEHEWLRHLFPTEAPQPIDTRSQSFIDFLFGRSDAEIQEAFTAADLYNTYAEAKNKPVLGSVETVTDANGEKHIREINVVSVEQARAEVAIYEAEQDWLKEKADKYYQWWDTFMREWAVGTSITLEDYEKMRRMYPHYVPTFREGKDAGAAASAQGRKVSSGKAVKKATGGVSEVRWVQDTLAEQVARLVTLRRTNDLLLNLIDTGLLDGSDSLGTGIRIRPESLGYGALMNAQEVDGDNPIARAISNEGKGYSISAWDNGQRITADIDEGLYKSLQSLFPQGDMIGKLTQIGRAFSSPMKAFITGYNPFFIIRNIGRDFGTALIQTEGSMLGYAGHYLKAYGHILSRNPRWLEYKALGNTGSQRYRDDVGLAKFDKIMSPNASNFVKQFLGAVGETTEAAARYAEYLLVAEKGGFTPDAKIRASKAAAEITTDFSRSGEFGKFLNAWIPYSNAATQGVDRVLRDFSHGKTAWTRFYRSVIVQAVPAAILSLIIKGIGREDEYDQISDYQKDNYYLVPIQDGKWLRIPKTETYGKLLASGVSRAFEASWGREDPYKDFRDIAGEAFNQSWTGADDALEGISDFLGLRDIAVAGSLIDLLMNKDFAGRDIVPSQFKDFSSGEFAPRSEQYDSDTSLIAYAISNMIANAFSPIEVDYLIRDYFGDFVHAIANIPKVGMLEAFSWQDLANNVKETAISEVSGAFVVDPVYSNRYTGEYYDMLDAMAAQLASDKVHLPEGEYKNTLNYLTKKAIEKKYGERISEAYKTARAAVGEAEKRDAREEAVMLSIEALDFYEQAMAGKYGDDPAKAVEYEPYGADVSQALSKLTQYEEDYTFEPDDSRAPKELTVNETKYTLTDEDKDVYKTFYREIYAGCVRRTILSQEYRTAGGKIQAEMLEDAADEAREDTTAQMREYLSAKVPSKYSSKITEALKSLKAYEDDYQFEPNSTYAPDSLTVGKDKYLLSDEQKDEYMSMYVKNYESHLSKIIDSKQYKSANPTDRAKMLAEAAKDARNETGAKMKSLLSGIDVKYVADSRYTKYEPYGDTIRDALLDLTAYEKDYKFEPNDTYAPESLSVGKTKYEMSHDQQDQYRALYIANYKTNVGQVVSSKEYRDANAKRRAELLEKAQESARDATTARMREILTGK